ncbi:MarR family transcriptional regulator [Sphingomonas sp.]|uniref:MarR family transcriptional regulator n=1 Tax=Sphingomonas sp. TaxID=28214 RepID=UPI002C33B56A|nr:MarR family transcriptional regulator [Sphingomonas sp.]HTG37413.1 MarR family transcriptional regulator [Sphingomonas sp.]
MIANSVASILIQKPQAVPPPIRHGDGPASELAGEVQALCVRVEQLRHSIDKAGVSAARSRPMAQRALETAKRALAIRRRRERLFGPGLFSEPVWDILLELYIARAEGCDVPVGNACLAASVPMTSALRWCQLLQDRGILCRARDPRDGRRVFLRMTDDSFARLTALLSDSAAGDFLPPAE